MTVEAAIPTTCAELIAAVEALFDCRMGDPAAYTWHPPRPPQLKPGKRALTTNEQAWLRADLKWGQTKPQKVWYESFALRGHGPSSQRFTLSILWETLTARRARFDGRPVLYWRLADKIECREDGVRTRVAICAAR